MQGQGNIAAIQTMGMLMSRQTLAIQLVLQLVQTANHSYFECQRIITILEDIFQKERSAKIILAVQILEYLVKNCNKNFHQAANKASFQICLMGLLKRVYHSTYSYEAKPASSLICAAIVRIGAELKPKFCICFNYENVYDKIIASYKQLRKEGVLFPPRTPNEKSLLFVKTESPIFENIEDIARQDLQKFSQKVQGLGLKQASHKLELINQEQRAVRKIDLDQLSENIAIVRSNGYEGTTMMKLIQNIRKDLEVGKVDSSQQQYWKDIKQAAENVISEWQQKNSQFIQKHQREFLESKMGKMQRSLSQPEKVENTSEKEEQKREATEENKNSKQQIDLLGQVWQEAKPLTGTKMQVNLLDM